MESILALVPSFEDREEIGEVVAQDVAGDGDGVLAFLDPLEGELAGFGGRQDADVEAGGVVVLRGRFSPWR